LVLDKNAKIYVAGHRGLVGSALVRKLKAEGYTNILTRTHAETDLTDQRAVSGFFARNRPEYVFLAAAKVGGILANDTYRGEFIYQNLMIQTNIIHQSRVHGVKRLLFLGSSCIYPRFAPQPMKEEHLMTGPLEPTNSPYAVAKIAGIEMCDAYNKQYQTSFLPVMPTNLYGPKDNFDLETSHALPALIRKFHLARLAAQGQWERIQKDEKRFGPIPDDIKESLGIPPRKPCEPKVVVWGTGSPKREFLHVDDMADACVFLMREHSGTNLINIGAGQDVFINELCEIVAQVVGFQGKVVFDPARPDGTPRKLLDVSVLNSLGWKARIGLREGIASTYAWYKSRTNPS